jgi:hypothetical protein
MSSPLLNEHEIMLNVGLGAEVLAAYTAAFDGIAKTSIDAVTLWHLATVLPLAFHQTSRRAIMKRQSRSGLRSILTRDPDNDIAENEPVFNLNKRMRAMFPRTIRSLNCALSWGFLRVEEGAIHTGILKRPSAPTGEVRDVIRTAEKLGGWAGQLTVFEYFTVLGVDFHQ